MPAKLKLKVGLLLNDTQIPAWAYYMVEQIQKSNYAEISLLVLRNKPIKSLNQSKFIYRLYRKVDRKLFSGKTDAFARKDIETLFGELPKIYCEIRETKFSDYLGDGDLKALAEHQPDVLIRLGFRILRGDVLRIPKYGVWSFHHGDNLVNKGGPPAFWEVMLGWPITGSVVQILNEKLDDGKVIYRSWSQTDPISVERNAQRLYWKSLFFIPRKLKELHENGEEVFFRDVEKLNQPSSNSNKILFKPPGNLECIQLIAALIARNFKRKWTEFGRKKQWFLLYQKPFTSTLKELKPQTFQKVIPPKDRFYADPFPMRAHNNDYVFFEELHYKDMKGKISLGQLSEKGFQYLEVVLEQAYHLSYPFIFSHNNEYFMIPESAASGNIELYKAAEFPKKWVKERNLMEKVHAVDTTVFYYDGYWWMLSSIKAHPAAGGSDELSLFYTSNFLEAEWIPHPKNPIVSDIRKARMAGAILEKDGKLYRPAQDCSVRYGYALRFFEISKLSIEEYEEREIAELKPDWMKNLLGNHSINTNADIAWMDAYQLV
jgi:hypothetical protein